jgi:phospholipid/cholesterol/gamma-HCH transport system substrate-binding protein
MFGAIFLIGKRQNMFGDNFHVFAVFRNVGGLQTGNNVRFVGVNVGTVDNISIVSDTEARVELILQESVRKYVKSNSVASIGSDGLMGDKLIVIATPAESGEVVKNGARLTTVDPTDFTKVLYKVEQVASNAEVITHELADIATTINHGQGSIGRLLHSDELAKNLEGSAKSIKSGTEGFSENMEALKHNFLLKGYYKKKEKDQRKEEKEQRKEDRKEKREERRNERKAQ